MKIVFIGLHEVAGRYVVSLDRKCLGQNVEGSEAFSIRRLVACRREFVTADAAGRVGILPLERRSIS